MKIVIGKSTFSKEVTDQVFRDYIKSRNITMDAARAEALAMNEHAVYGVISDVVRFLPGFTPVIYSDLKAIVPEILVTEQVSTDDLLIMFILGNVFRETLNGFEKMWANKLVGRA